MEQLPQPNSSTLLLTGLELSRNRSPGRMALGQWRQTQHPRRTGMEGVPSLCRQQKQTPLLRNWAAVWTGVVCGIDVEGLQESGDPEKELIKGVRLAMSRKEGQGHWKSRGEGILEMDITHFSKSQPRKWKTMVSYPGFPWKQSLRGRVKCMELIWEWDPREQ